MRPLFELLYMRHGPLAATTNYKIVMSDVPANDGIAGRALQVHVPKVRRLPTNTRANRSTVGFGSHEAVTPLATTMAVVPTSTKTRRVPVDAGPVGRSRSVRALMESEPGEPTSNVSSRASSIAVSVQNGLNRILVPI